MSSTLKCPFKKCKNHSGFSSVENLSKHLRTFHGGEKKCPICQEVFEKNYQLHSHVRGHVVPGLVPNKVHSYDQPTFQALNSNQNRTLQEESRIVKMFKGVCNLMESKEVLDYCGFVISMHPAYKIPLATFECISYQDMYGIGTIIQRGAERFIQDPHYSKGNQAALSDYDGSGYERAHLVSACNYTNSRRKFYSTFVYTNCVPVRKDLNNGPLNTSEDFIRNLVLCNGRALIITLSGLPTRKDDVEFLVGKSKSGGRQEHKKLSEKDKKTTVAIPMYVGKIVIIRNLEGLHVKGWKFLRNDKFQRTTTWNSTSKEDKLASFFHDPFELAKESGFPLEFERSNCATINGVVNPDKIDDEDLDSQICPLYKEFFEFLQTLQEDVPQPGPSEAKKRRIETVTLDSEDDEDDFK